MCNNICGNAFGNNFGRTRGDEYYVFGRVTIYPISNNPCCRCGCMNSAVPYMAMMPYMNYCMYGNGYALANYRPFGSNNRGGGLCGADC